MGQSGAALNPYTAIGGCTASSALIAVATVIANAIHPAPTHYNCGVHGKLNPSKASAAAITTITSASCANTGAPVYFAPNKGVDYCRDQCVISGQPNCATFEYDADTDSCTLFTLPLPRMGLQKGPAVADKNKVQFNRHCFSTTSTSATPTATTYSWCSATPSVTIELTDPTISYPGKCLGQDFRGPNAPSHVDFLEWVETLPFDVQLYGNTHTTFTMGTTGGLTFDSGIFFDLRNPNTMLPTLGNYANELVVPLWQRQQVNNGTGAGLSYSIVGAEGSRIITWSWTTASQDGGAYDYSGPGAQSYSYDVTYEEAIPGVFTLIYHQVTDGGLQATIGAQSSAGDVNQYSFETSSVSAGATLVLDSTATDPQWIKTP